MWGMQHAPASFRFKIAKRMKWEGITGGEPVVSNTADKYARQHKARTFPADPATRSTLPRMCGLAPHSSPSAGCGGLWCRPSTS